jgi:uncharacterized protein YceK
MNAIKERLRGKLAVLLAAALVCSLILSSGCTRRSQRTSPAPGASANRRLGTVFDSRDNKLTSWSAKYHIYIDLTVARRMIAGEWASFVEALATEENLPTSTLASIDASISSGHSGWLLQSSTDPSLSAAEATSLKSWFTHSRWAPYHGLLRLHPSEWGGLEFPNGNTLGQLLGFVHSNGEPGAGLLLQYNSQLKSGSDLKLTVDLRIQQALEHALDTALQHYEVADAMAIRLSDGHILAIASRPGFDPGDMEQHMTREYRLRPVVDVWQTGPMLKPFLLAAAAESASPKTLDRLCNDYAKGVPDAGVSVVGTLGTESVLTQLHVSQLTDGIRLGFPGESPTITRHYGPMAQVARDLANGSGVAPSMLTYSAALASLISSTPMPTPRIVLSIRPQGGNWTPAATQTQWAAPERIASYVRHCMIKRGQQLLTPSQTNAGLVIAQFHPSLPIPGRYDEIAVAAVFSPTDKPRYLVTVKFAAPYKDLPPRTDRQSPLSVCATILSLLMANN